MLSRFTDASTLISEVLPEGGSVSEKELGDIFVQMYPAVRPDYVREGLKCILENLAIVSVQVLSTQYVPILYIYYRITCMRLISRLAYDIQSYPSNVSTISRPMISTMKRCHCYGWPWVGRFAMMESYSRLCRRCMMWTQNWLSFQKRSQNLRIA